VSFDVNLLAASATVKYLPDILSHRDIQDVIEDTGFGAELMDDRSVASQEPPSRSLADAIVGPPLEVDRITRTTLSIHGMTCASCSTSITKALRQNDKIISVNVDVLSASGSIEHLASLQASAIKDIIEDAGFAAEVNDSIMITSAIEQSNRLGEASSKPMTRTVQIHVGGIYCLYVVLSLL
jgi:copper chaperone CopZ